MVLEALYQLASGIPFLSKGLVIKQDKPINFTTKLWRRTNSNIGDGKEFEKPTSAFGKKFVLKML